MLQWDTMQAFSDNVDSKLLKMLPQAITQETFKWMVNIAAYQEKSPSQEYNASICEISM